MFWNVKIKISKLKIKIFLCGFILILFLTEIIIGSTKFVEMPRYTSIDNFFDKFKLVDNNKIVYIYNPGAKFDDKLINNQGFIDTEFVLDKRKNLIRIAMLGDSITAGAGVGFDQNFSYFLENALNRKALANSYDLQFEVMNFGVSGYRSEAMVEILRTIVLKYSPDVVVLNYNICDTGDSIGFNFLFARHVSDKKQMLDFLKKRFKNRNSPTLLVQKVIFKSKLCVLLAHRLSDMYVLLLKSLKHSSDNYKTTDTQSYLYDNLLKIKQMQKSHGFKFLICVHPTLLEQEKQDWFLKVGQIIEKTDMHYFQMLSYYNKEQWSLDQLRQNKRDIIHPNEIGHSIIAEAMCNELIKIDFIPEI